MSPERRRDFVEELRRLDEELRQEAPSAALEARLRQTLEGSKRLPQAQATAVRPVLWLAVGCAAALLLFAVFMIKPAPPATAPAGPPLPVAGFQVESGSTAISRADRSLRCISASCALRLRTPGVRVNLAREARIRRKGEHTELVRGTVTCAVRPRMRGRVKIYVSHGVVEVTGTLFRLQQGDLGGRVTLYRGSIRFSAVDGRVVALRPGQSLAWPLPPQARAVVPGAPADAGEPSDAGASADAGGRRPASPPNAPLSQAEVESLHGRVERLRSQGRYVEAARALRDGLPRVQERQSRELLSFELGEILTHHLRDVRRACQHWRQHLQRHGPRRYGAEIDKARRTLSCP